jgi:hypothetical protein
MKAYLVMKLCSWEDFVPSVPLASSCGVKGPEGSPGFMVIYTSREAAIKAEGEGVVLGEIEIAERSVNEDD